MRVLSVQVAVSQQALGMTNSKGRASFADTESHPFSDYCRSNAMLRPTAP